MPKKITINYPSIEHRLAISSPSSELTRLNLSNVLLNESLPFFSNAAGCFRDGWSVAEGPVTQNSDQRPYICDQAHQTVTAPVSKCAPLRNC